MKFWKMWTLIPIWKRTLIAMFIGILGGIILPQYSIYFAYLGEIFIRLLKLIITPLIFLTLLSSISQLKKTLSIGKIISYSIFLFVITTTIATIFSIAVTEFIHPGNLHTDIVFPTMTKSIGMTAAPTLIDNLINIIPKNPANPFMEGNILQIIFLAVIFGIAIATLKTSKELLLELINISNEVIYSIIRFIMEIMPIGIFGLLYQTVAQLGMDILYQLLSVILILFFVSIIHIIVVFGGLLKYHKIKVWNFFKHISEAMIVAFSTSSSSATIPTSMNCAKNLNMNKEVYSFVIPLGATINMNGSAMYQAVSTIFIAQILGVQLVMYQYFLIIVTTLISAIGTAGVPGAGLIMLTLVLQVVGLPIESLGLIMAIDRILDMIRTTVNITGDIVVSQIVSLSKGIINTEN